MLDIHSGGFGSGKTYDAIRKILPHLKNGRRILTNIDGLNEPDCRKAIYHLTDVPDGELENLLIFLKNDEVECFWEHTKVNDFVVIDEAHKYFHSHDWKNKNNRAFSDWCTEMRHNGNDVLLITPQTNLILGSVRSMCQWHFKYKKLIMMGKLGEKRYIRFAFHEDDPDPLAKKVCSYDRRIFACYKTHFTKDVQEVAMSQAQNIFKHPIFFVLGAVIILFIYSFSKAGFLQYGVFGTKVTAKEIDKAKGQIEKSVEGPPAAEPSFPLSEPLAGAERMDQPVVKPKHKIIGKINGKTIFSEDGLIVLR